MRLYFLFFTLLATTLVFGQKKALQHEDFAIWNTIEDTRISDDGRWVSYYLNPGEGDHTQCIYDGQRNLTHYFPRGDRARFSADSKQAVFLIHPPEDSLREMRRRGVKKKDLPKDTLAIYYLLEKRLVKIPGVKSFKLPEKWPGWLAYHFAPDTLTQTPDLSIVKGRKESKSSGSRLVFKNLNTGAETMLGYATQYTLAEEGPHFAAVSTGNDTTLSAGVYHFSGESGTLQPVLEAYGEYRQMAFDKKGTQLAFLANHDTTDAQIPPYQLYHWTAANNTTQSIAGPQPSFLGDQSDWIISEHGKVSFSENGKRLFFGVAPPPILQDTSLLDEEIVNVEVWHWQEKQLYTQQEVRADDERKRNYQMVWFTQEDRFAQLGDETVPEVRLSNEGNGQYALGYNAMPYWEQLSWDGYPIKKDIYVIDVETGLRKQIGKAVPGNPSISPAGKYLYWFNSPDTTWQVYHIETEQLSTVSKPEGVLWADELNDRPMYPYAYGIAGWLEDDAGMVIYDRYDLWQYSPPIKKLNRLTLGRTATTQHRYIRYDRDERAIAPDGRILLRTFNESSKNSGYSWLDLPTKKLSPRVDGPFNWGQRPQKAKNTDQWITTRESFQEFPDLRYGMGLGRTKKITDANPQQKDYQWGTIELVKWQTDTGQPMTGMLVKPDNFDPKKKYPLLINFYERSSNGLHNHRRPFPHRSTINYHFYASRGYVIFNPDVPYKVGYPGESALTAVNSGTDWLLEQGFIDEKRMGLQGHSWGGYQIAHILSRTNRFACAESGAPVVNMTSAYGGIRWGSGMSRMFQYEKTQSRIGATLWDNLDLYLENSPLFSLESMTTPVLILHNDEDGAVPWYQGIEYFVALRRLQKPAWLLNYNGEPHWPVKLQNRKDFQRRMQQFFDHYLLGTPMPGWMQRGVPAIEKGIRQGMGE